MGILDGLFTGAASGLVETVGKAIDNIVTSDEERLNLQNELKAAILRHEKEMVELEVEKEKILLADINSARDNHSSVQEAENASWLAKNIQPFLALFVCLLGFAVFGKVLFGTSANINEHGIVMMVLGAISGYMSQILSFFYGAMTEANGIKGKFKLKK